MSNNRQYILWVFAFILFVTTWLISVTQPNFIFDSVDVEQVSEEIQSVVNQVEIGNKIDEDVAFETVIEDSDSIIFWSSNKIDFEILKSIEKVGIYNLSSRIYLVWIDRLEDKKYYYLIPLKKDFEFENIYLRNTSFETIYFPKNYRPSSTKTDYRVSLNIQNQQFDFYFEKLSPDKLAFLWTYLLFIGFLLSLIALVILAYRALDQVKILKYYWKIAVWLLTMLVLRFVLVSQIPFAQSFYLFQPYDFANSFISSLGMLIINTIWSYLLVFYSLRLWTGISPKFNFIQSILAQFFAFAFFLSLIYLIHDIIINSTSNFIDFDNVVLRYQDILLLLVFGTLILLFVKVFLFILHHTKELNASKFIKHILILYLPLTIALLFLDWHLIIIPLFVVVSGLLISLKSTPYFSKQTVRLTLILLGSVFVVSFVEYISSEKELENRSLRLGNYQTANNRLAEYLLSELDEKLMQDSSLLSLIYQLPNTEERIYDYIQKQYFTGFWSEHRSNDITICASNNIFKAPNDINSCKMFFDKKIGSLSKKVDNSHFVVINDYGMDQYLGKYQFLIEKDSSLIDLYIMLKPKEQHKNLGYPSILLSNEVDNKYEQNYYSFAKYINGQLASHTGKYNYSLEYAFPQKDEAQDLANKNGYYHLIEEQSSGIYNVISAKQHTPWTFFIILSYVFILYIGSFYFFELLNLLIQSELNVQNTLKGKLRLSFLGLLVITFVIVAWAIIYKSAELSEKKQENVLDEKMQSVLVELKHKLSDSDDLKDISPDYLNYLLIKFSNVFFTDINLYDLSGQLMASSRPEVFDKGLIGDRMNPDAFWNLATHKKSRYIHNERIGAQQYLSAYIPFKNPKNESIAYLNLPYFAKDKEMKSEISTLVTAFLNIFVFLFLITGLFTVFISNRITLPLVIIQQKLKDFSLGKKNETIVYNSKDEIGALVSEYNRTVEELNKNIELLAQKEREGAWKEMAKQIAHEIKNPLTPMKLSIQHLKHVWKDDSPDKDQKINDTVDLIVRQIDNLAEIASAFSDFSKMTIAQQTVFSLIALIKDQIYLHNKEAKIELIYDENTGFNAFADEQQISRVFQNIISNAIQSVANGITPEISIKIESSGNTILTQICDNGKGMNKEIQERLFEPNFTTKNSGMGLGLAIVKQIVENNSGQITFKTKEGKGTCFSLVLPKAENTPT